MIHLHLAAAGGGSAGFGGGSGGFGHGGGGRGFALYLLFQFLIRLVIFGHGIGALIVIGLILLAVAYARLMPRVQGFWSAQQETGRAEHRRTRRREHRVTLAAAEAAEEDPAFAPDVVKPAAARLFTEIQAGWDAHNLHRLGQLLTPELLEEWEQRLHDLDARGWRNRVTPLGAPTVEYVGLTQGSGERRVVVRIEAKMHDYVEDAYGNHVKRAGRLSERVKVREYWTLVRNAAAPEGDSAWILASIEQGGEGAHALADRFVATPWSDEPALHDEALVEQAVQQAVPEGTSVAEVADLEFSGDARAAALDLSLADGRFAPDVLEIAARRAVDAWAQAVDGSDAALAEMATPAAIAQLLYAGDPARSTRVVVRGPAVQRMRITALDAGAVPPTMSIEIDVQGRRYIEDRHTTAVLSGSRSRPTSFTERWILTLTDDARRPWQLTAIQAAPARA